MNQIDEKLKILIFSNKYQTMIEQIYKNVNTVPSKNNLFRAFELSPLSKTKVVIVGQDPYYIKGMADGLAFSTNLNIMPKSLKNIFWEIKNEYPNIKLNSYSLVEWAKQGVLLLNAILTTEVNKPLIHKQYWSTFILDIINLINCYKENVVFVLWGKEAQKLSNFINKEKHKILFSPHPSPLSASKGFFGNNHFILINKYLKQTNQEEINWNILNKNNKMQN